MQFRLTFFIFLSFISTAQAQKILFVGNSLTYTNNMPSILENIGKSNGFDITTQCICKPNYGLEDHINEGLVAPELRKTQYDFVIFQQGPSSQAYGRKSLLEYGKQLSMMALASHATPAYLMVWPSTTYYQTFDGVIKNHTDAARSNGSMLIPLGIVWQKFNKEHKEYELYGPDGFHPSRLGSLLEAMVILKSIAPEIDLNTLNGREITNSFKNNDKAEEFLKLVSLYLSEL